MPCSISYTNMPMKTARENFRTFRLEEDAYEYELLIMSMFPYSYLYKSSDCSKVVLEGKTY